MTAAAECSHFSVSTYHAVPVPGGRCLQMYAREKSGRLKGWNGGAKYASSDRFPQAIKLNLHCLGVREAMDNFELRPEGLLFLSMIPDANTDIQRKAKE